MQHALLLKLSHLYCQGKISEYYVSMMMMMIYLSTAIVLTPGGSGTVYIYTQTIHRTTQITEQHK